MLFDSIHLFGCTHVPDFPVQAWLRAEAAISLAEASVSFKEDPAAVLDGPDSSLKVVACNERARKSGIRTGMTKLQAEACPAAASSGAEAAPGSGKNGTWNWKSRRKRSVSHLPRSAVRGVVRAGDV